MNLGLIMILGLNYYIICKIIGNKKRRLEKTMIQNIKSIFKTKIRFSWLLSMIFSVGYILGYIFLQEKHINSGVQLLKYIAAWLVGILIYHVLIQIFWCLVQVDYLQKSKKNSIMDNMETSFYSYIHISMYLLDNSNNIEVSSRNLLGCKLADRSGDGKHAIDISPSDFSYKVNDMVYKIRYEIAFCKCWNLFILYC